MAHLRRTAPAGHGELLTSPELSGWPALMEANAAAASSWDFELCGRPVADVRSEARREAVAEASVFSERLGVPLDHPDAQPERLVLTGHQPELYHPGIWAKDFLLQRLADRTGAAAIDIVVDTDSFDTVSVRSPCMVPEVSACSQTLAVGGTGSCYACSTTPSQADIDSFVAGVSDQLDTLRSPALGRHFRAFAESLSGAAKDASDLAETITIARRRYEAPAGTRYLELPLTAQVRTRAYATFVGAIALRCDRFAEAYNEELAAYRAASGTRSAAQPVPDLRVDESGVELPFWVVAGRERTPAFARPGERVAILSGGEVAVELPAAPHEVVDALLASGVVLAPKALALTMFERLLVADLFIHGVGGARYDGVTDAIARRFFGVTPPAFVVASLTMYLPLGMPVVHEGDIDRVKQRLNRLSQNPDQMLGDVEFDDPEEKEAARALAAEKAELVARIAEPGADKRALGERIRSVNEALSGALSGYASDMERELERLEQMMAASEVLTDRTYPFCFWDPREVADKAR